MRFDIWKLNPVTHQIVGYPKDSRVDSLSSSLLLGIGWLFLLLVETSLSYPVILSLAINFTKEPELRSTSLSSQSLDALLNEISNLLAETNTSPFKGLSLLDEVWNGALMLHKHLSSLVVFAYEFSINEVLNLLDPVKGLLVSHLPLTTVDLLVSWHILDLEVVALHKS